MAVDEVEASDSTSIGLRGGDLFVAKLNEIIGALNAVAAEIDGLVIGDVGGSFAQALSDETAARIADVAALAADLATEIDDRTSGDSDATTALGTAVDGLNIALEALEDRIASLESLTQGDPGDVGATPVFFRYDDETDPVLTDDVSDEYVAGLDMVIVGANAWLRGATGSADVTVDVQADLGSGFATVFTTSPETRLVIPAGDDVAPTSTPTVTSLPAGKRMRSKVISAPTDAGALTWVSAAQAGDGDTTTSASRNIPIPASYEAGDLLIAALWCSSTSATWPGGWTQLGAPIPVGSSTGPMWMYIATKTASGSESGSQAITISNVPNVCVSHCVRSGSFETVSAGNVNTSPGLTAPLPTDISTTVADSLVIHFAGVRIPTGLQTVSPTFSDSLATDASAMLNRGGANVNFGLYTAHETKASAGAIASRSFDWTTNTGRYATTSLIVAPAGGSAAEGLVVQVLLRQDT